MVILINLQTFISKNNYCIYKKKKKLNQREIDIYWYIRTEFFFFFI